MSRKNKEEEITPETSREKVEEQNEKLRLEEKQVVTKLPISVLNEVKSVLPSGTCHLIRDVIVFYIEVKLENSLNDKDYDDLKKKIFSIINKNEKKNISEIYTFTEGRRFNVYLNSTIVAIEL